MFFLLPLTQTWTEPAAEIKIHETFIVFVCEGDNDGTLTIDGEDELEIDEHRDFGDIQAWTIDIDLSIYAEDGEIVIIYNNVEYHIDTKVIEALNEV